MTRLSVAIDGQLLDDAQRLAKTKTKRDAIERALQEFVQRRQYQALAELAGSGLVDMDLEELTAWREAELERK